jgi:hypothetical protein
VGRGDVEVKLVGVGLARGRPQQGSDRRGHLQVPGRQRVGVVVPGLVLQPLADRQVGDDADAKRGQLIGRPDAGAEQDGRAAVGAAGEDDLTAPVDRAVRSEDTGGGRAVEQHPVDVDVAADGQVGPTSDLLSEVDQADVLPDAVDHVDRVPVGAVLVRPVEVVHPLEALRDRRLHEPEQGGRQLVVGPLPDRLRAGPPVKGVVATRGVLELLVDRKHVVERPAVDAVRAPPVEVGRAGPQRHRRVHRRTAADHLAARSRDLRLAGAVRGVAPVVGRVSDLVRVEQRGRVRAGIVSGAGLEQHDRPLGVLAEAGRDDRAR